MPRLATTEEQIAEVERRLLDPNISEKQIEKWQKILAILKEED